jgi:hypothetical protein
MQNCKFAAQKARKKAEIFALALFFCGPIAQLVRATDS